MKESEFWLVLAQEIHEHGDSKKWTREFFGGGLCVALGQMQWHTWTSVLISRANTRLRKFSPRHRNKHDPFWWAFDKQGNKQRILVCCFLAVMAEDAEKRSKK